jgi:hypothetical protein
MAFDAAVVIVFGGRVVGRPAGLLCLVGRPGRGSSGLSGDEAESADPVEVG